MANINITSDAWTEISITSGTVQNISATADIELSAEQTDNSGVVLKPSEIYQWDNETIYARAVTEEQGALRVVNFKKAAGGGGSYVLPVASSSTLGGVKVGSNLSIDAGGVLSAVGGGSTSYSTTEQVIGTWIDGKPVYQITNEVSFSNKAVGSLDWIRLVNRTDINLDRLIFSYAKIIFDGHSNDEYIVPYYAIGSFSGVDNSHPASAALATSNGGISVQLQQYFYNDTLSGKIVFTLQYTKTTD